VKEQILPLFTMSFPRNLSRAQSRERESIIPSLRARPSRARQSLFINRNTDHKKICASSSRIPTAEEKIITPVIYDIRKARTCGRATRFTYECFLEHLTKRRLFFVIPVKFVLDHDRGTGIHEHVIPSAAEESQLFNCESSIEKLCPCNSS